MIKDLKGSFGLLPDIDFSLRYWFDGVFQENKEKYLNENFGFRNTYVRINNQVKFNLFKKTSNKEIVIGKDNELFAWAYIESYTGENFIGAQKIISKCKAIKELQDKMLQKGKVFLPVIAPNKARVLKEFLPENTYMRTLSNYEAMIICFKKLKVDYLDFNDYFIKQYNHSEYPLHSKYGVHWSSYGHSLAADSIVNYLNYNYHLNTPKMVWKKNIYQTDKLRELDYDAGDGLNLLVNQLPSKKMAYTSYDFVDTEKNKPSLLIVGDSYNFGIEFTEVPNRIFSDYKFLYYFKELRSQPDGKEAFLRMNLKNELESHQVCLLITTEHNFINYGWGFIEKALNILDGKEDNATDDYTREVKLMELKIRQDKFLYNNAVHESFLSKSNLDSAIVKAAKRAVNQKIREAERTPMNDIIKKIKSDPQWMKDVRIRAIRKGISVDSAIILDAKWQLDHSN